MKAGRRRGAPAATPRPHQPTASRPCASMWGSRGRCSRGSKRRQPRRLHSASAHQRCFGVVVNPPLPRVLTRRAPAPARDRHGGGSSAARTWRECGRGPLRRMRRGPHTIHIHPSPRLRCRPRSPERASARRGSRACLAEGSTATATRATPATRPRASASATLGVWARSSFRPLLSSPPRGGPPARRGRRARSLAPRRREPRPGAPPLGGGAASHSPVAREAYLILSVIYLIYSL